MSQQSSLSVIKQMIIHVSSVFVLSCRLPEYRRPGSQRELRSVGPDPGPALDQREHCGLRRRPVAHHCVWLRRRSFLCQPAHVISLLRGQPLEQLHQRSESPGNSRGLFWDPQGGCDTCHSLAMEVLVLFNFFFFFLFLEESFLVLCRSCFSNVVIMLFSAGQTNY